MSVYHALRENGNYRKLKNKLNLTWADLAPFGIKEAPEHLEARAERWVVGPSEYPVFLVDDVLFVTTAIVWKSPKDALQYYAESDKKVASKDATFEVKHGVFQLPGNRNKTEGLEVLNKLGTDFQIDEIQYAPALTPDQKIELQFDGIADDRSNVTFFYFSKRTS